MMALLTGPLYKPLSKDDQLLRDITDELVVDGYDRQVLEGRKVEVRSGQIVLAARDLKFTFKEPTQIGSLVIFDNGMEGKPLVAYKSLMAGDECYKANPGLLLIELKNGLAILS